MFLTFAQRLAFGIVLSLGRKQDCNFELKNNGKIGVTTDNLAY